ncbi:mannose-6-phosphate isomerase, class I [Phycicoccus endophyticus]|uniref:mannose-6-phosphate isomerase n=1 Tax=Phycicoccus endophyticus TaxID=1690220 RepID=A0A7G9QYQ6_9MICO|nr:mannose-6-phosphate isomerase, class I [Phycicoccus endophyticus]NHI20481.1 mannose-6-phosphate isomerase, class I [Phycicoccus endophyticus]QNN48481.1 mannose-6-phosphate isomerase, class I [Phycicoccus endophyticus]GGL30467.1 mannose-6-phosphate isomerase, class I [Phycicoccus endophyticus]
MDRLRPVVFNDAWGSYVAIASLQGRAIPTALPESELWMGAHESGPAGTSRPGHPDLARVVAEDPERELGAACVARHGSRLPFLLKVLAPGRAISIQAHPTAEQAARLRALTGDAVYVDDSAKPELLLAITRFEVFVGMRTVQEVAGIAARLGVAGVDRALDAARGAEDPEHALLRAVLETPPAQVPGLVRQVVAACVRLAEDADEVGEAAAAVVEVAETHPDDIGLVVLLLMHHRVLRPGEYVDVAAGVLHSYVHGLGLEVLANSDNVVRAGLTSKEVNVEELLRIVDPTAGAVVGRGVELEPGVEVFPSATDCFLLHRVAPGRQLPGTTGPRLVFCLRGRVGLTSATGQVTLGDVESVFLPAGEGDVVLEGAGEVYLVTVPGL